LRLLISIPEAVQRGSKLSFTPEKNKKIFFKNLFAVKLGAKNREK
jgi:hypothetical protein